MHLRPVTTTQLAVTAVRVHRVFVRSTPSVATLIAALEQSLEETTKLMSRHQVGRDLTDAQVKSIVVFLGALAGDPPKDLVTKPDLPPSGPKTPKPD